MTDTTEMPAMQQITLNQAKEALKRLDMMDPISGDKNPDDDRLSYQHTNILAELEHPGGGYGMYAAHSRYLSPTRLSIITKVFMHEGSKIRIHMPDKVGLMEEEDGSVTKCTYIGNSIHEAQITFKNRLNLRRFMELPSHFAGDPEEQIKAELISGRVLLFSESEADVRLIKHFLRESRVQFTEATTLGVALDRVRSAPFDIVISGELVGGMQAERILTSLTEAGYSSDFVVIRSSSATALGACNDSNFTATLNKPLDAFAVLNLFAQLLGVADGDSDTDHLHSNLPNDPSNVELVEWYIDHVKRLVHGLEKAMMAEAVDDARSYISTLRDTGTSYGFPTLSEQADKLLIEVNASGSISECRPLVQRCVNMTRRMRCMR